MEHLHWRQQDFSNILQDDIGLRLSFQEFKPTTNNLYENYGRMAPISAHAHSLLAPPPSGYRYLGYGPTYFRYTPLEIQVQRGFENTKLKTQLCRQFEEQGKCDFGSRCAFAHGVEELRNHIPLFRTKPCKRYLQSGVCAYGNNCHFIHPDQGIVTLNDDDSSSETTTSEKTAESDSLGETAVSDSLGETAESDSPGENTESDFFEETAGCYTSDETYGSDSSEQIALNDRSEETFRILDASEDSECLLLDQILRICDWESEGPALVESCNDTHRIGTEFNASSGISFMNSLFV